MARGVSSPVERAGDRGGEGGVYGKMGPPRRWARRDKHDARGITHVATRNVSRHNSRRHNLASPPRFPREDQ